MSKNRIDITEQEAIDLKENITEEEKDLRERTYEEFCFKETVDEESAG